MKSVKSPAVIGALWIVMATFWFAVMALLVRYVSATIPALETVFFRSLVGIAILLPWLLRRGIGSLRTRRLPMVSLRIVLNFAGVTLYFFAIGAMPIAKVVSLHFTLPLFGILGAAVFLREGVGAHRWIGAFFGFVGVLVVLRPGMIEVNHVALLVLLSAAGYALSDVVLKSLMRTEAPDLMVFFLSAMHAPLALIMIPLVSEWVTPTLRDFCFLIAIGVCGVLAHMCSTRAFRIVDASYIMLLSFIRMPMVAFGAYLLFGETVDELTVLGAAIIFGAAYYATNKERKAAPG